MACADEWLMNLAQILAQQGKISFHFRWFNLNIALFCVLLLISQ